MFTFKSDRLQDERVESDALLEGDIDEACVVFLCRDAPSTAASGTVVYVYREPDLDLPERALTKRKDGSWSFEELPSDGTPDQPDPPDSIRVFVTFHDDVPDPHSVIKNVSLIPPHPAGRYSVWDIPPTIEAAQAQAQAEALREERQAALAKLSPREREVLGVDQ